MSENFNLPPKVAGRDRGYLDFVIENIHWKTLKTFGDVKICISWWGQSEGISCEGIKININKSKIPGDPLKSLRYHIKTNNRLFVSYLKNCEPIKFEVYSSKTGDFIGSSKIAIPLKFHNLNEAEQSCRITSSILSSRQFSLGEVAVSMNMKQVETMTHKNSSTMKDVNRLKTGNKYEPQLLKEQDSNKENIQVVGRKKKISFREPKPSRPSTLIRKEPKEQAKPIKAARTNSTVHEPPPRAYSPPTNDSLSVDKSPVDNSEKSSLIHYLSGEPMSRVDENNILHNLATISPTSSIIEGLNRRNVTFAPTESTKQSTQRTRIQLADKMNSIRVTISHVEFNAAGQLETQSFMNKHRLQKCILKCAVTSKSFKHNSDVKVISSVFETAPKRIQFTRQMVQRVTFPVESDSNRVFINFGFCVKPIDQQSSAFFVGFSRVDLLEVINSKSTFHKKCPIISESDMKLGSLIVKIELGINELHFGRDLIDSIYGRRENISVCSDDNSLNERVPVKLANQKVQTRAHPSHSNDQCDSERNYENKNVQTDKASTSSRHQNTNAIDGLEERDTEMIDVEKANNQLKSKVYSGLLFIEGLRNIKDSSPSDYFITYEGFWNECQESTEASVDSIFNYLKQFPVICDDSFLKRVQNNHLELKLWEKTERSEKWIGSTKVPLHQFYIAFRDATMIQHLSTNPLPVISIDNWSNFNSPISSDLFCQGKVLLAIGSDNQIEYLKVLRNMHNLRLPIRKEPARVEVEQPKPRDSPDPNSQMKNKLSAFIESLSQKLPEPSMASNFSKVSSVSSSTSSLEQPQLRKTSELLDTLQKALSQPPTPMNLNPPANQSHQNVTSDSSTSSISQEKVKMLVTIEHASHLPKVIVKKKQNRRKNKNSTTPQKTEFEPSAYATFESSLEQLRESSLPTNVVKSHEGFVHCTKAIKSCDPIWDEKFEVEIPLDVVTNPQKRFVVKVWRKVSQDSEMRPVPFEDAVVGFSAVDLSVLLTGFPILSGYYNIMDFSGRCNGQIKLSIKPMENLAQYQDSSTSLPVTSFMNPLNIDVGTPEEGGSNLLSRTLKRKFTELDEITQRLKARLFDVTGDENFDPDEEFERDLNTAVEDMEEDNHDPIDFAWLKNDSNGNESNTFESQLNKLLENQPSTSKNIPGTSSVVSSRQREVSGCSHSQPMAIDQLLKKYDLDTLINPSIFKNILDPTLANSDSTPTLNPQPINTEDLADVSGDSGDTTVSSILSNDQVQTIEKALQKTSLASDQSSSRKDPDGETNLSE